MQLQARCVCVFMCLLLRVFGKLSAVQHKPAAIVLLFANALRLRHVFCTLPHAGL